jgi:hypothetical protein
MFNNKKVKRLEDLVSSILKSPEVSPHTGVVSRLRYGEDVIYSQELPYQLYDLRRKLNSSNREITNLADNTSFLLKEHRASMEKLEQEIRALKKVLAEVVDYVYANVPIKDEE